MTAIPRLPSDITPAWLTATLHSAGVACDPVTRVDAERVGALVGITSVVLRVRPTYGGSSGPASLIAKLALPDSEVRERIRGMYEREICFYRELAHGLGALVPKCYLADQDGDGWFILLLEDLSYAREGDDDGGCGVDDIRCALAAAARLHADWWERPGLEDVPWLSLVGRVDLIRRNFAPALERFLTRFGRDVSSPLERVLDQLGQALASGRLDLPGPRTLIHGDLSAKNVFFVDAGATTRVVMFDWQLTAHAHAARDVARLINVSPPPDAWTRNAAGLLHFYREELAEAGVGGIPFESFLDSYRRESLRLMVAPVIVGGGIADPGPERVAIARRFLERAPVILESFDPGHYLA